MTTLFKNLLVAACIATAGGARAADWAPGTTTWEQLPEIKRTKLGKHVDMAPEPSIQPLVDPKDYLARLQAEDYL